MQISRVHLRKCARTRCASDFRTRSKQHARIPYRETARLRETDQTAIQSNAEVDHNKRVHDDPYDGPPVKFQPGK